MRQWRTLLWVVALGLLAGPTGNGCSSKKEKQEEEEQKKMASDVSLFNIRVI